jgi:hypothetical protein
VRVGNYGLRLLGKINTKFAVWVFDENINQWKKYNSERKEKDDVRFWVLA